ncbi:MAG: sulfatase-like hydrolase/transferase [Burkholderiales bacterium]|nr:sulfatase-like hydrolase/transferase [Burkholderiales bacterium]
MNINNELNPTQNRSSRYALLAMLAGFYLVISSATRVTLAGKAWAAQQIQVLDLPRVLLLGLGFDLVTCVYLITPLAFYLLLVPQRIFHSHIHRAMIWSVFTALCFGLTYLAAVEYFFFDEFNARFNFVAVEYLIYPHEVFVNIWQSYPVGSALAVSAAIAAAVIWRLRQRIRATLSAETRIARRLRTALVLAAMLVPLHFSIDASMAHTGHNRVADELSGNGIYSFFSAAMNSRLDYEQYYLTLPAAEAAARARALVAQPNTRFISGAASPIARHVSHDAPAKRLHVIVVLEESLGAEFVGAYGAAHSYTPNLDRIAAQSLVFTNTYASGTRTVRGMEAVTASFPPVPAESIVKRPHNERMFNWSTVMSGQGYSPTFIYGGYGTFDNMNAYFGSNGYRVIDRTDFDTPKFSNIWGVSDEDLFRNALAEYDRQYAGGERIFSVIMTTSNHKPFTFPEGIPGIKAKGGGREAGVRYADYALGRFIDALQQRSYFENTLVVVVADHGARVYGREDIPLPTYAIPFLVYSPRHIQPQQVTAPVSQLDVAPTVLGLLNFSYDSTFFGRDALAGGSSYIPLNHNRDIALYQGGALNLLGFRKRTETVAYDAGSRHQTALPADTEGQRNAASVFQLAHALYAERRYRVQ